MDKQEIFDTVVQHLAKQKTRALTASGWACAYRGKYRGNDTMCAVGCLISDKDYLPTMEGKSVTTLKTLGMLPDYLSNELDLLCDLQIVHDAPGPDAAETRANLRRVAGKYRLDSSAVDCITEWKP